MSQTLSRPAADPAPAAAFDLTPRKFKPVKFWAWVGVLFVAFQAYGYTKWIVSGNATPTPAGDTPLPERMKLAITIFETVGPLAALVVIYYFLIRPWKRDGHISLDGFIVIGLVLTYWQNDSPNWYQNWFTFNVAFTNWGSWNTSLPLWNAPNSNLIGDPILACLPMYHWCAFLGIVVSCHMVAPARRRWPQMGLLKVIVGFYLCTVVLDSIVEPLFMWATGIWGYPGSKRWLTLFPGHYYQYPVYEGLLWGITWGGWAFFRYFRDDKGRSLAERGADELKVGPRAKTWVRGLAVVGVLNALFIPYNIGISIAGLYSDPWPKDFTDRSYLTGGVCGPGTPYSCGGPDVPVPRPNSAHLDPEGKLVVPE